MLAPDGTLLLELALGPGSAHELVRRLTERTEGHLTMSPATRHRVLRRLEERELISKEIGHRENPNKKGPPAFGCNIYSLTPEGDREVHRLRRVLKPLIFGIDPIVSA